MKMSMILVAGMVLIVSAAASAGISGSINGNHGNGNINSGVNIEACRGEPGSINQNGGDGCGNIQGKAPKEPKENKVLKSLCASALMKKYVSVCQ